MPKAPAIAPVRLPKRMEARISGTLPRWISPPLEAMGDAG